MSQLLITEIAPAKINLALHVTGQRADGYHLLDSLVTFADRGDVLTFEAAPQDGFSMSGRFADGLPVDSDAKSGNLVLKARELLRHDLNLRGISTQPVHIHLEKNLPIASGIGGGSADAAAALRGLIQFWGTALSEAARAGLSMSLGADIPMCFAGIPLIARGIGEDLQTVPLLPRFALVLANPLMPVSTPQVFKLLSRKDHPPMNLPQGLEGYDAWLGALGRLRNDLEPAARQILPEIAIISGLLSNSGADLVRMSGSGATCFGVFPDFQSANDAADALSTAHPDWYFQAVETRAGELA